MTNGEWIYVDRKDYAPVRQRIESYINDVQSVLRPKGLTFQYDLIGSGRRRMVTIREGSNKGYDFDYNIKLQYVPKDATPKEIKDMIRNAFRQVMKGSGYKDPEDSSSVLTIKMVDTKKSSIKHSFDLGIICHNENGEILYIHYDKISGTHHWNQRGYHFDDRNHVQEIKDFYVDGWGLIRDEYIKLKNRDNDPSKHSYNLYVEAVRNVYDHMRNHPQYARNSLQIVNYGF